MATNNSRLHQANVKDWTQSRLSDAILQDNLPTGQVFYLGQVIESKDPKKANRLRVRIPLVDDIFYHDQNSNYDPTLGNDKLPWCIPANSRFIDTPENGAIVLVGLANPDYPYLTRIWFTAVPGLSNLDMFANTNLTTEKVQQQWSNAEQVTEVRSDSSPTGENRRKIVDTASTPNYDIGIRGKDKNKLLFQKAKSLLVQNENQPNQSYLELSDKALLTAKRIDVLSSNTPNRYEAPVFAKPLFQYETQLTGVLTALLTILTTIPALSPGPLALIPGFPLLPNPAMAPILTSMQGVVQQLIALQQPGVGSSQYIRIN